MARTCIACKQKIPDHESAWRDMKKRYACQRCYVPGVPTARVVKHEG